MPPIDGTVTTPRMEIAGAQLEGVEIVIDEPAIDTAGENSAGTSR